MEPTTDVRVPREGEVPQAVRLFRLGWVTAERQVEGVPAIGADYLARVGQSVHVIDVRAREELRGPLGHVPGTDWVPLADLDRLVGRLSNDEPLVFVSGHGDRAREAARRMLARGFRFVAHLAGGLAAWRRHGFETRRDLIGEGPSRRCVSDAAPLLAESLSVADIYRHLGDPSSLFWTKAASLLLTGRLSCVDGRDAAAIVGTPGGDAGELLLMLAALESVKGRALDEAELARLFLLRLDELGRFYLHSDMRASSALADSLRRDPKLEAAVAPLHEMRQWVDFLSEPPRALQELVLEHVMADGHLGCGHVQLARKESSAYGVRAGLADWIVRAFMRALWSRAAEPEFHILPGGHEERAVLRLFLEGGIESFASVPMVPPSSLDMQAFVVHPDVARFVRTRYVRSLFHAGIVSAAERPILLEEMDRLAALGAQRTLGALAHGLPIFDVHFRDKDHFEVVAAGHVT